MATILVVDDSSLARNLLGAVLREAGYEAVFAPGGIEGLREALTRTPDLILTDLLMPDMDGLKFIAALRGNGVDAPIIVLSANIQETMKQKCREIGVTVFLNKPLKKEAVLEAVGDLLHP